jgi:hypothetical protein
MKNSSRGSTTRERDLGRADIRQGKVSHRWPDTNVRKNPCQASNLTFTPVYFLLTTNRERSHVDYPFRARGTPGQGYASFLLLPLPIELLSHCKINLCSKRIFFACGRRPASGFPWEREYDTSSAIRRDHDCGMDPIHGRLLCAAECTAGRLAVAEARPAIPGRDQQRSGGSQTVMAERHCSQEGRPQCGSYPGG